MGSIAVISSIRLVQAFKGKVDKRGIHRHTDRMKVA
jgi:hypothetical protein